MEQTTLQQRIEERAKNKLLKDLYEAAEKEVGISSLINYYGIHKSSDEQLWQKRLSVRERYNQYGSPRSWIEIENEYSQIVFDTLLPKYIRDVTDEILRKIDEIDYLVFQKEEDLP